MMRIIAGLNSEARTMSVTISSPLMKDYFLNFQGMMNSSESKPKGLIIERKSIDTALVQFPMSSDSFVDEMDNDSDLVRMSKDVSVSLQDVITIAQRFCLAALKVISKKTEFCPIIDFSGGYSFKELQKDVIIANENKRDFVLIDSYKSYKDNIKSTKYEFNQYRIPYGTNEYCDFLLSVRKGNLKEIQKTYKDKLKKTNWF